MADKANTSFDWFEIFTAGKHTDSKGQEANFSKTDLAQVVANFAPKKAPLVIGHPKMDDPAWGWASELKIEGDKLFAKAEEVSADFAQAVQDKRYPNRSVRLVKTEKGFELGHIGFLGGKPPAVDGLKWQFSAEEVEAVEFEFAASEQIETLSLHSTGVLVSLMSNLKTFLTDRFGSETAKQVIPEWEAEHLKEQEILARHTKRQEEGSEFAAPEQSESGQSSEENTVTEEEKQALEDKLKAEQEKNAKLQFNQRVTEAQAFIDKEVNGGKAPRITNTDGAAEFMAHLGNGEAVEFEFAAADGKSAKQQPLEWFKSHLKALPEQTGLTKDFSKADEEEPQDNTAEGLAARALEFQQSQAKSGIVISVADALAQVSKEK